MGTFHIKVAALALAALLAVGAAGRAGQDHPPAVGEDASQWHSSDHARVRLIRGGLSEDGRDMVGLVIELEAGWHTYWRSPGALGLPPTFNWEGSENIRGVEVEWPVPQHISDGSYETYGYENRTVLPLLITREDPAAPTRLTLALGYAVCETVCIPTLGFVSMALPPPERATTAPAGNREDLEHALALVPVWGLAAAGVELTSARLNQIAEGGRVLILSFRAEGGFNDPQVIVEGPKGLSFGASVILLREGRHWLEAAVPIERAADGTQPIGRGVMVTLMGARVPVEFPLDADLTAGLDGVPDAAKDSP
jgi:DsbC/DsbD-like thiol-disulfide interchange protein